MNHNPYYHNQLYRTSYLLHFNGIQAGIVSSLDSIVKEFVSADKDEKKAVYARLEAEVGKLDGSSARLFHLCVHACIYRI